MMLRLLACLAASVAGTAAVARAGAPVGPPPVLFTHVRVIDGTGAPAQPDRAVLVENGRIAAITASDPAPPVPAGTTVLNLAGDTMIPGLMSDHSHVGLVQGATVDGGHFTRAVILAALRQYEAYGVTTVTALGVTKSPLFDTLRREQHAGTNAGADLFGVDQGISVPGGAPPDGMMHADPGQILRPATPKDARAAVDRMADEGTDLVKLWVDDFRNGVAGKPGLPIMSPAIWQAAIEEAHARGLRVAVHIHDLRYARLMVAAHADILAHGVRDQPVDQALIDAMKRAGTWYIPTIQLDEASYLYAAEPGLIDQPELAQGLDPALRAEFSDAAWRQKTLNAPLAEASRRAVAMNQQNLVRLVRAGVNVGFGTDSGAMPLRIPGYAEHRELRLYVQAGLTPLEALSLATSRAAALMKLDDRGSIAVGRRADLVILGADPSADITAVDRIEQVWRGGVRGASF
ncbi:amidohydrolase family protein [Ameyamaea chiangmaiensis]|uniref:Amidohydrolase family protein n=2 Tax=Ameyamaea chiangmaiensis TaxID=442969 RepID=A0A850PEJ3_9PROT|nr:amidohydrolase family protein [Ameyamaea chiangmaiensis]MBS4075185.1 amidohydrolase family protein [Ameyamaea chiangmaiensis]NVN41283.1 amidohydrolase family protein [Ameyamaea chiangmaiensis]